MMTISVKAVVDDARRTVESMTTKNFEFSVRKALTRTAKDAQTQVRASLPSRFKIRRTWVPKGIRIKPSTPSDPTAWVYSIDEFMSRQEDGSDKVPKNDKYLAIPLASVRRTKADIISQAALPMKIPNMLQGRGGQQVASITTKQGEKFMVKLKGKRSRGKENRLIFLYSLRNRAKMKPRLGLVNTTLNVVKLVFGERLEEAIRETIARG